MITVDGRGRLIYFDLAREVNYSGAQRTARAVSSRIPEVWVHNSPANFWPSQGTWRFMSTRLLTMQEKVHELSDDLESHFFVLLFEGLHFVKHNKPFGIFMQNIFDYIDVDSKSGKHSGGMGKAALYGGRVILMNTQLEFMSKPFTTLIRGIYRLFVSFHQYHLAKDLELVPSELHTSNVEKLMSFVGLTALFDEALESKEWPTECDKVLEQYPPTKISEPEQGDSVALSHFDKPPAPKPPYGKRKRETEREIGRSCRDKRTRIVSPP